MHAHEYKPSILMKTGRHLDVETCALLYACTTTDTHTLCAKLHHSNKLTMYINTKHTETQAYAKANQAHLHASHFKPSSSHPGIVSRFREKCFLSTQLHTDVVQSSLMNILLQPYVTATRVPGAAAQEHFRVVPWEVGAAVTSSWGKDNSWSQTSCVRWLHYSFA